MKETTGIRTLTASALTALLMVAPLSAATAAPATPSGPPAASAGQAGSSSATASASAGSYKFSLDRVSGNKLVIDYQLGSDSVDLKDTGSGVAVTHQGESTTLPSTFTDKGGNTYSGDWDLANGKLTFTTDGSSAPIKAAAGPGGMFAPQSAYTECATDYIAGGTIFGIAGGAPGVVGGFLLGGVAGTLICLDN